MAIVGIHLLVAVLANYLGFWLRFDGQISSEQLILFGQTLLVLVAIRSIAFQVFCLYEDVWRYTSLHDLRNIVLAAATSTIVFVVVVRGMLGYSNYPRSVFLIDALLLVFFLGGIRITRRLSRGLGRGEAKKRILIYGAGDAGEMIVRDMLHNPSSEYEPIGFVDDDVKKVGQRIHGVRVLGTRSALADIITTQVPGAILVAMPCLSSSSMREIVKSLELFKVPLKTLPSLREILDGRVEIRQIRNLSIEDLLDRTPVNLDVSPAQQFIKGRRVMVTGAGGSIGSELCRQIQALEPTALILYERYENNLHQIYTELDDQGTEVQLSPVLGDVTDRSRLQMVMQEYRPDILFHAAAHKHVPLMEMNPSEAVKNNVVGTRILADMADRYRVERFILISTDKAVNPTSMMGATKRLAELIVQDMARRSATVFVTVRFGNVLGSNGSVVPRFLRQIQAGGPVTVTDPEVRRYFMLIPEAVQLVLQAASLGEQGAVYVLDMGEQIKLVDLAKNLIRLSGFVPDIEIPIRFVGLRSGEKLFEELFSSGETVEPSIADKIMRVRASTCPLPDALDDELDALADAAEIHNEKAVVMALCRLIPNFQPTTENATLGR